MKLCVKNKNLYFIFNFELFEAWIFFSMLKILHIYYARVAQSWTRLARRDYPMIENSVPV